MNRILRNSCYPLLAYMVGMMAHEAPHAAVASFQLHIVYVSWQTLPLPIIYLEQNGCTSVLEGQI